MNKPTIVRFQITPSQDCRYPLRRLLLLKIELDRENLLHTDACSMQLLECFMKSKKKRNDMSRSAQLEYQVTHYCEAVEYLWFGGKQQQR